MRYVILKIKVVYRKNKLKIISLSLTLSIYPGWKQLFIKKGIIAKEHQVTSTTLSKFIRIKHIHFIFEI